MGEQSYYRAQADSGVIRARSRRTLPISPFGVSGRHRPEKLTNAASLCSSSQNAMIFRKRSPAIQLLHRAVRDNQRIAARDPNPPSTRRNVEASGVGDTASVNSCASETGLPYDPAILVVAPVVRLVVQRAVPEDSAPAIYRPLFVGSKAEYAPSKGLHAIDVATTLVWPVAGLMLQTSVELEPL